MIQPVKTDDILGPLNDFERKHAPEELFIEGDKALLTEGVRVSVVGSRKASEAGVRRAKAFTQALVRHDITVVSGLADGIDTVAHGTAIAEGGKTIAVLGTPLDKAYPAKNKELRWSSRAGAGGAPCDRVATARPSCAR